MILIVWDSSKKKQKNPVLQSPVASTVLVKCVFIVIIGSSLVGCEIYGFYVSNKDVISM